MKRQIVIEIISFLFILLFVYAALNKLLDYQKFTIQIGQSPLLTGFGGWLPSIVIGCELLVAVMLVTERYRKLALYGCFGLMLMFTIYIVAILSLGSFIPCSCGGVLEKLGWEEHLIFNSVFVLLALISVILYRDEKQSERSTFRRKFLTVFGSIMCCLTVMMGLIYFSGELRDKRNSFLRLFPSRPVLEGRTYDLPYNSYYLAGGTAHHIYLANYSSPLHMLVLNTANADPDYVKLNVEGIMEQKFWSVQIAVDSPYYYAYDGAVPRIYKGNVNDWKANRFPCDREFFLDLVPIGPSSFFLKSLSGQAYESMLGKITIDTPFYYFDRTLLKKQVDGFFCTDGTMLYNRSQNKLIYLYRYRNEYIVMDTSLYKLATRNTIDTVRKAQIKVVTLSGRNTRQMAAPPLEVNKRGDTHQNWLFVQSNLLGRNEHPKAHDKASVIDVYNLLEGRYRFSFYVYDYGGKEKLRQFRIYGNNLVALFDTHIQLYTLRDKYFSIQ